MRLFEPQIGGHRLRLDDLMLIQDALREAISGVISALHPSLSCILSGAKASVSGGQQTITDGFVAFKGEVFTVSATSFPFQALPSRLFLKIDETVITPSPVVYQDQTSKDVHLQRVLVAKYFNAADGDDPGVNGIYYDTLTFGGAQEPGIVVEFHPTYAGEENDVFDTTGLGVYRMKGWAICNGLNNTPDLRGQFTFMPSSNVFNSNPLLPDTVDGAFADMRFGKKDINILQANLPNFNLQVNDPGHTHTVTIPSRDFSNSGSTGPDLTGPDGGAGSSRLFTTAAKTTGITVSTGGSNLPLTNLPPSFAMLKIKRIAY